MKPPPFFYREKKVLLLGPRSPGRPVPEQGGNPRDAPKGRAGTRDSLPFPKALPISYPIGTDDEGDPLAGGLRRLERVGSRGEHRFVQILGAARRQQQAGPPRVVHLHRVVSEQHHQPFRLHRTGRRVRTAGGAGAAGADAAAPPHGGNGWAG